MNDTPLMPSMPLRIHYTVQSPDTGVQAMVHTYFGEDMEYIVYDSNTVKMSREALAGGLTQWYADSVLYIRETAGDYCSCVKLEGSLLQMWMEDEWISDYQFTETSSHLGFDTKKGAAADDMGDTTWVEIAPDLINPWFENPSLPGLPMKYAYRLRGKKVNYEVDKIETVQAEFDPFNYSKNCVNVPPAAYMGMAPDDSTDWGIDDIWIFGNLLNENDEYVRGQISIEEYTEGQMTSAKMSIDQGTYDVQLLPGKRYILDFTAADNVHKRIELDCSLMPENEGSFLLNMDVNLFPSGQKEVDDYLKETPIGYAVFNPDSMNLQFDFEYTRQVAMEISRIQMAAEE